MIADRIVLSKREFDSIFRDRDYCKTEYKRGYVYKDFQTDKILGYYDKSKDCYYIEKPLE